MHGRVKMDERRLHEAPYELLQHDHYTAEEAAEALLIGVERVRHAVFTGELPAHVVGHEIISINREDIVAWLQANADASR
jgi:excisionase family DNA binding protein